jgi:hypothetical protein
MDKHADRAASAAREGTTGAPPPEPGAAASAEREERDQRDEREERGAVRQPEKRPGEAPVPDAAEPERARRPVPGVKHEPEPDAENIMPAEDEPGTL